MKKTTTWSPDTCNCIINYEWDDTIPENVRSHRVTGIVKKCSFHQNTVDLQAHFDAILEENSRKNDAVKKVKQAHPGATINAVLDGNRDVVLDVKGSAIVDASAFAAGIGPKVKITLS